MSKKNKYQSFYFSNRDDIIQAFMQGQPIYDLTPPAPIPYPKLYHYSLDPNRHCQHQFLPSFLANTKPLLIPCDVGIPVDELILFSKEYNNLDAELDPEDEALIKESIMTVSQLKKEEE